MMFSRLTISYVLLSLAVGAAIDASQERPDFILSPQAETLMESYCFTCHDDETQKGEVRLDHLDTLSLDARLELLNRMQEQIYFGEMPPKKKKKQPSEAERQQLADWISGGLKQHQASKLEDKLRMPAFGNYVDHDKLFSGEHADLRGFTPDRRWLISEYIFDAKMNQLLNHLPTQTIDGKRQMVMGDNNRRVNLTNPFLLPTNTGVRYYDTTTLDGGHLLTMLTNAKEVATYMVYLTRRDTRYLPAIEAIMHQEWEQEKLRASRETFLGTFIETVLEEIYGDEHEALLPVFVPIEIKPPVESDNKKSPFHAANPGTQELILIFHSMQRLQREGDSDEQLIKRCEREWFNHGHDGRKIQTRLTFLAGYLEEFRGQIKQHRYEEKHKLPAYRPPQEAEMKVLTDALTRHRKKGDRYNEVIRKCMADWDAGFKQERMDAGPPDDEWVRALVEQLFVKILEHSPTTEETDKYATLAHTYIQSLGNPAAIEKLIQTLLLKSEFVYRQEFGQGDADASGRKMLSPRDASYALAYALTDSSPDKELAEAVKNGELSTREDYRREVQRMLKKRDQFYVIDEGVQRLQLTASITAMPIRELRFFRDFFGYPKMLPIFKDNKRFGSNYDNAKGRLVGEADRLVHHILEKDTQVFEELLSTDSFYVYHSGDNEAMTASSERIRKIYDYFKDLDWENFEQEDLIAHSAFLEEVKMRGVDVENLASAGRRNSIREFKTAMTSFTARFDKGQTAAAPFVSFPAHGLYNAATRAGMQLRSPEVARFFNIELDNWNYPSVQPAPVAHRKGMLTHPAWLIAHAQNTETDPVIRGKWVREKLLAGTVPDIPITVEAVIPEDHHKTLRDRLVGVTETEYCWKCHQRMNPLGYAFELYDDFGRYRREESLEHPDNLVKKSPDKGGVYEDLRDVYKTLPVNARGYLDGTGDPALDGEVADAIDLAERLTKSDRVRQSIIRHAFRYFMGRNEVLSDSETLIEADKAYLQSSGSFDALIVSLLTSDSFIYRK
ncbi:MAG: hypothetical protein ACI97B_002834 [Verrucomicrobiales bacterium]|jgi:hypothetical protein